MEISLKDGLTLDTNKLSDRDAAIHEALNNLYKVCKQFGAMSFARVIMNKTQFIGMNTMGVGDDKAKQMDYELLMESLGKFINESSSGKLALMMQSEPE